MNKLKLFLFNSIKNLEKFLLVVGVFLIVMITLYWIQGAMNASWRWVNFFAPVLDSIVTTSNKIFTFKLYFGDSFLDLTNIKAIIFLLMLILAIYLLDILTGKIEEFCDDIYRTCKKVNEDLFNKQLAHKVSKEEKQLNRYMFYVQIRLKSQILANRFIKNINIEEQKQLVHKYILDRITVDAHTNYLDGVLYYMRDFNKVDGVVDVLKQIPNLSEFCDYLCCVQISEDITRLNRIIGIQSWGKITISADTLLRYNYNKCQRYKTSNVGIFQSNGTTIEIHEFV